MKKELIKIFLNGQKPDKLLSILFKEAKHSTAAWEEFLRRYSKLFLKIIWKHERDYDLVMERFVLVCEKLCQDDFKILKKYKSDFPQTKSKLSTWLTTVVNNICIDIYRKNNGRKRFPKALKILSEKDKQFFMLYYWKGFSMEEISLQMDLNSKPGKESASDIFERIESVLTRSPRTEETLITTPYEDEIMIAENENEYNEFETILENLIEELPAKEKIIIRLRFWENLSAKEISEVMNIKPYQKVYSVINSCLKVLRKKTESRVNI